MGMSVGVLAVTYSNKLKSKLNDLANQTIDKMNQWKDDYVDEEDDEDNIIDEDEYDFFSSKKSNSNYKKSSPKQKKSKLS